MLSSSFLYLRDKGDQCTSKPSGEHWL